MNSSTVQSSFWSDVVSLITTALSFSMMAGVHYEIDDYRQALRLTALGLAMLEQTRAKLADAPSDRWKPVVALLGEILDLTAASLREGERKIGHSMLTQNPKARSLESVAGAVHRFVDDAAEDPNGAKLAELFVQVSDAVGQIYAEDGRQSEFVSLADAVAISCAALLTQQQADTLRSEGQK